MAQRSARSLDSARDDRWEDEAGRWGLWAAGVRGSLRGLKLFSGACGTTEVVPFHEHSRARVPALQGLMRVPLSDVSDLSLRFVLSCGNMLSFPPVPIAH